MYVFFLDMIPLPITPAELTINCGSKTETCDLIEGGEISILKSAPLKSVSFDFILPQSNSSYVNYPAGFAGITLFISKLEKLKKNKKPFQFIVVRTMPNGTPMHFTNMKVSLESLKYSESSENGLDTVVSVELLEYREPETALSKVLKIATLAAGATVATVTAVRETAKKPSIKSYTVQKGDTLWALAKRYYGDGSKYNVIAKANKIANPNVIQIGQKLKIPEV